MAKLGMDVDAVRGLASQLDGQAQRIMTVIGSVDAVVRRAAADWHGAHSSQFTADWHNRFRPALQSAHDSISGLAISARNNAKDQASVSGAKVAATAGPAPHVVHTFSADTSASASQISAAQKYAHSVIHATAKEFPGATAQLQAWSDRLQNGQASEADVEALRRYAALIQIAELQRGTVLDAANLAVANIKDAGGSTASTIGSAIGAAVPGSGHYATDLVEGVSRDVTVGALNDKLGSAITHGDANAMLHAYDASADAMLTQIGTNGPPAGSLRHVDYGVAFESTDILRGRYDEQNYDGIANDATHMITGDGSVVQSVGTGIISAIPGYGRVYSGLSAAASAVHGEHSALIAINAIDVANVQSLQQLQTSAELFRLIPTPAP